MAKSKKPAKPPAEDWVKLTNFRLEPDVLDDLDAVADHYSAQFGMKVNRTAAVRIAIRNERRRIKPDAAAKS
jgi:hypothetical protein